MASWLLFLALVLVISYLLLRLLVWTLEDVLERFAPQLRVDTLPGLSIGLHFAIFHTPCKLVMLHIPSTLLRHACKHAMQDRLARHPTNQLFVSERFLFDRLLCRTARPAIRYLLHHLPRLDSHAPPLALRVLSRLRRLCPMSPLGLVQPFLLLSDVARFSVEDIAVQVAEVTLTLRSAQCVVCSVRSATLKDAATHNWLSVENVRCAVQLRTPLLSLAVDRIALKLTDAHSVQRWLGQTDGLSRRRVLTKRLRATLVRCFATKVISCSLSS